MNESNSFFFLNWRTQVLFVGPLITLFWTALVMSALGFKAREDSLTCMLCLSTVCNGFLRFTSGVTLADLLVASMAAEPFHPFYLCTSIGMA